MTDLDDRSRAIASLLDHQATSLAVRPGTLEQVRRRARQRHQRRVAGVSVVGAAAAIGGIAALTGRDGDRSVAPADTTTGSSIGGTTSSAPLSPDGPSLTKGDTGAEVSRAQDRLRQLGFDPGPTDGVFGDQTEQAVWAFEGLVIGRSWQQQTGTLDERSLSDLFDPATVISPQREVANATGHTEIRLDLQALVVFHGDRAVLVTHVSSGSGETWCEIITQDTDEIGQPVDPPVQKDVCGVSKTPGGVFQFYRRLEGSRQGLLGGMYNPVYFNYGIAVHGAQNVPRQPVSHGGIRIPMTIAEYFPSLVKNKDIVFVWDGTKEPEQQSEKDMLPVFAYPNPG
jgi:hypothetical protein